MTFRPASGIVPVTGLVSLRFASVKPSAATVHRTVAFKWVRVRFQQRIKAMENVSFSMAFIGAGDRIDFIKVSPPSSRRQATVHRTVALYGFDPGHFGIIRKERPRWGLSFLGAGDRDRTGTLFRARDFKSLVSACSTTPASIAYPNTFLPHRQANARSFCRFSQEAPLIFFSHLPLLSRR